MATLGNWGIGRQNSNFNICLIAGDEGAASSKVHTRNVVNFAWDHDYYPGQVENNVYLNKFNKLIIFL